MHRLIRHATLLCSFVLIAPLGGYDGIPPPADSFRRKYSQRQDEAVVTFDLEADLRPLFNWGTNLVFVYVSAEYATEDNPVNQVVVWDMIVRGEDQALISLQDVRAEYYLVDQGYGLRDNNVTLHCNWNRVPVTGMLEFGVSAGDTRQFPEKYI